MTPTDNIKLTINNHYGISGAIDTAIDAHFNDDIKLNLQEWNSVFNIIKEDSPTETKQYKGGDTDITDGKNNYKVQAGSTFQITQNAWKQILGIVENKLGITQQNVEQVDTETEQKEQVQEKTTGEKVYDIIDENNLDVSNDDIEKVIEKYDEIIKGNPGIDNTILEKRIINFVNGLKFAKVENTYDKAMRPDTTMPEDIETAGQTVFETNVKNKADLYQLAEQQIEHYDNALGDGKISFDEFIEKEEKKIGEELSPETKELSRKIFNELDLNKNEHIDKVEFATFLWAMSTLTDKQNEDTVSDITFKEYYAANMSLRDIALGNEDASTAIFQKFLQEGYKNLKIK